MIEQPAGRGDDDVDAAAEGVLLRTHAHTAKNRRGGQRRVDGEVVEVLDNLRGQLTRGRQHEGAGRAARLVDQTVKNGQQERRGLAAAGHGAGQEVVAFQHFRNRVGLDGRGPGEAEILETLEQAGMESEFSKCHRPL